MTCHTSRKHSKATLNIPCELELLRGLSGAWMCSRTTWSRPRPRPGPARGLRGQGQGHKILFSRSRPVLEDPIPELIQETKYERWVILTQRSQPLGSVENAARLSSSGKSQLYRSGVLLAQCYYEMVAYAVLVCLYSSVVWWLWSSLESRRSRV